MRRISCGSVVSMELVSTSCTDLCSISTWRVFIPGVAVAVVAVAVVVVAVVFRIAEFVSSVFAVVATTIVFVGKTSTEDIAGLIF